MELETASLSAMRLGQTTEIVLPFDSEFLSVPPMDPLIELYFVTLKEQTREKSMELQMVISMDLMSEIRS